MSGFSIAENFNQYFSIKLANTQALKEEAFKIRYNVYSKELGWEPCNDSQIETDEYDFYSYHCILEHKRTKVFAGCIRLVTPPEADPSFQLPFEKNAANNIDLVAAPRGSFGELSRLAVLASFRRREKENRTRLVFRNNNIEPEYTEVERRSFPYIAMGLYLAGIALAEIFNHQNVLVMMEPRLKRNLQRLGLPFEQVSDLINFKGNRAMFNLPKEKFSSELTAEMFAFYQLIHSELSSQMAFPSH